MSFEIYYRSTQPVSQERSEAIDAAASAANAGRTWLSCEPVKFFIYEGGHIMGGSKPNFMPHPDDVASAASSELPDGTTRDMLDILCQLSRDHAIDWEISHDHSEGVIGRIRGGVCDPDVLEQIELFSELADILGESDRDSETGGTP